MHSSLQGQEEVSLSILALCLIHFQTNKERLWFANQSLEATLKSLIFTNLDEDQSWLWVLKTLESAFRIKTNKTCSRCSELLKTLALSTRMASD